MQETPFTISIIGLVKVNAGKITISLRSSEATIDLEPSFETNARLFLRKGQNLFDIVLKTAQDFVASEGKEASFSAADLYHLALDKYPYLKRNSWTSHVIACAPDHKSYRNYGVRKDYFVYESKGVYRLKPKYLPYGITGDDDRKTKNTPDRGNKA
jgi:hypothetical protein